MYEDFILWAGTLTGYKEVEAALVKGTDFNISARSGFTDEEEDEEEQFQGYDYMTQLSGDIAVVSVKGNLVANESHFNRYFGVVSYPEIQNAVAAATNHPEVVATVLDVGSNGGDARGPSGLAKYIAMVDTTYKPVYAYTGSSMSSAAYWLSAGARKIYATDMATVGSIGVLAIHQEITKMLDMAGIKATVLREGEFKALGTPYETLTPKARDYMQSKLHDMYNFFTADIADLRGLPLAHVESKAAEGQTFWGPEAKAVGLVDEIMTLEEVVNQLSTEHNSAKHSATPVTTAGIQTMAQEQQRIIITAEAREAIAAGMTEEDAVTKFGATETEILAGGEGDSETTEEETTEDTTEDTTEEETTEETGTEASGISGVVTALTSQLSQSNDKIVDLTVDLRAATTKLDTLTATHEGLRAIAVSAVNKMQIRLGGSAQDLSHLDAPALLAQYASVEKTFHDRYPVGSKATVSKDKPSDHQSEKPNEARLKAVSF